MDLKNAVAVCLISLFSATLVVMIARALDSQAASRIEPQLASIVEELQAIRKQGGISSSPATAAKSEAVGGRTGRLLLPRQHALPDLPGHRIPVPRDGADGLREPL